jgi:YVTN family beta-propeller protein
MLKKVVTLRLLAALSMLLAASSLVAQQIVATIPVPNATLAGVAVNPVNNRVYVGITNQITHGMAVIDSTTNTLVAKVPLPINARFLRVNLANGRIYVAGCNYGQQSVPCFVTVVNGSTYQVIATIPISGGAGIGIQGLAVNPFTNRIYVSNADGLTIDVIDGNTNVITDSISLGGQQPLGLDVDLVKNRVYAAINGPVLAVIDGKTNQVITRVTVGQENGYVAVNPIIQRAYVSNYVFGPSTLGVVNGNTLSVVTNVNVGNTPFQVAVDIFSDYVFVTNLGDNTVSIVDGKNNLNVATVMNLPAQYVDVNPQSHLAYVSGLDGNVYVVSEP